MTWRVFWFLIRLGVLGALAVFFATNPGRVSIDWQGWAIDMPVGIAVLVVFLIFLLIIYGERIRLTLFQFPNRWRAHRKAIREMKGYRALTLGLVAVAAGERDESRRHARRARDLLTDAPLTKLLQAQSARLAGDDQAALAYFEEMRGDPEVAFLGLRGLMTQALQSGDKKRALELAEEAQKLRPTAKWVLLELLDLQTEAGQWGRALATLDQAERTGALAEGDAKARRTLLATNRAQALHDGGKDAEALKLAQSAVKAGPTNTEALALTANLLHRAGKTRKAEKLIEDHWADSASAGLAAAYADLSSEQATALEKVKRFEKLHARAPDSAESHMALADAALNAELWGEARSHLAKATDLLGDPPPPRLCRLWARLEEAEHGDLTQAHTWLLRATDYEAGSQGASPSTASTALAHHDDNLPI